MSDIRIATDQTYALMRSKMQHANRAVVDSWTRISDGKRILHPSDHPADAVRLLCIDRISSQVEQHLENVKNVSDKLDLEETQINAMIHQLRRCKELALQANNDTIDFNMRAGMSIEVESLADSLAALVNTQSIDGRYIFGGFADDIQPVTRGSTCHPDFNSYQWGIMSETSVVKGSNPIAKHSLFLDVDGAETELEFSGSETSAQYAAALSAVGGIQASAEPLKVVMAVPPGLSATDTLKVQVNGRTMELSSNIRRNIEIELDKIIRPDHKITAEVDTSGRIITFEVMSGADLHFEHKGGLTTKGSVPDFSIDVFSRKGNPMQVVTLKENESAACAAAVDMDIEASVERFSYFADYGWDVLSSPLMQKMVRPVTGQDLEINIDGRITKINIASTDTAGQIAGKINTVPELVAVPQSLKTVLSFPAFLSANDNVAFSVNGGTAITLTSNKPTDIQAKLDLVFTGQPVKATADPSGTKIIFETVGGNDFQLTHAGGTSPSGQVQPMQLETLSKQGIQVSRLQLANTESAFCCGEIELTVDRNIEKFEYTGTGNFGQKTPQQVAVAGKCGPNAKDEKAYVLNNLDINQLHVRIDKSSTIPANDPASHFCVIRMDRGNWSGREVSLFDFMVDFSRTLRKSDRTDFHYKMSCFIDFIDLETEKILSLQTEIGGRQSVLSMAEESHDNARYYWNLLASDLRDLDYADAVARASEEMLVLDAIRHSFNQISSRTLFDYLF